MDVRDSQTVGEIFDAMTRTKVLDLTPFVFFRASYQKMFVFYDGRIVAKMYNRPWNTLHVVGDLECFLVDKLKYYLDHSFHFSATIAYIEKYNLTIKRIPVITF